MWRENRDGAIHVYACFSVKEKGKKNEILGIEETKEQEAHVLLMHFLSLLFFLLSWSCSSPPPETLPLLQLFLSPTALPLSLTFSFSIPLNLSLSPMGPFPPWLSLHHLSLSFSLTLSFVTLFHSLWQEIG